MDAFHPESFARNWAAAWNRSDFAAVLAHFAEDAVFVSPLAARVTGDAEVRGKAAMAAYWRQALQARPLPLHFVFEECSWDAASRLLLVVYISMEPDGSWQRKSELFHFRPDGLIGRGEAFAGAVIASPARD